MIGYVNEYVISRIGINVPVRIAVRKFPDKKRHSLVIEHDGEPAEVIGYFNTEKSVEKFVDAVCKICCVEMTTEEM